VQGDTERGLKQRRQRGRKGFAIGTEGRQLLDHSKQAGDVLSHRRGIY
jgi:hypothetical protein